MAPAPVGGPSVRLGGRTESAPDMVPEQPIHLDLARSSVDGVADACVCICTHNGQATIGGCLDALSKQHFSRQRFVVLVVDDGSTDGTAGRIRRFQRETPTVNCRVISQPRAGLSAARNAGLQHADAPIVAYIDDDAIADPAWLEGVLNAFRTFPTAGAVGGQVVVRWQSPRPTWWQDDLDEVFNRFRPADEPTTLDFPQLPYGCNFAVRRDAACRLGGFRTDLGRQNGRLLAGEETDLLLRMIQGGHQVAYWPTAIVEHLALANRVSRRYILKRAWHHGRSLARITADCPGLVRTIPALRDCVWRMIRHAPRYRFRLAHWKYWLLRFGYHYEARTLARSHTTVHPYPAPSGPLARGQS